jgi:hypothetical protein
MLVFIAKQSSPLPANTKMGGKNAYIKTPTLLYSSFDIAHSRKSGWENPGNQKTVLTFNLVKKLQADH